MINRVLITLLLFITTVSFSQDTIKEKKVTFAGYPVVYYSPETSYGYGGFLLSAFRFNNQEKSILPSQITLSGSYTGNKQLSIYIPYQLFLGQQDYILKGELGYYRYFYRFFGVGNELPNTVDEIYKVNFPRVRVTMLKNLKNNLYVGANYAYDGFNIVEREANGILIRDSLAGSSGGILSGFGPAFTYDSRDNIFFPSKGYFIDLKTTFHSEIFGATFNYGKIEFDIATYIKDKWDNVWAFNYYSGFNTGVAPINDMLELGGGKKGRGLFKGKYRDRILNIAQAEYRFNVWKRFSAVTFASYGGVSDKIKNYQLKYMRFNYGLGARFAFNQTEKINVRLDVGFGDTSPGFYVTLSEAF